jgi:AraC-like DNA-binding protein/predicted transcriptional regulator YdeE
LETVLNHIDRLNRIIEYVETHLDNKLDLSSLAAKSALSKYHFHRVFKALLGEQPLKYVERRRITRAAHDLLNSNKRIIDIAFDFGFGSHESFTRTFKKWFLLTPSQFRKAKPNIQFENIAKIGPLDLRLSQGIAKPNPVIIHKPTFSTSGYVYSGNDTQAIDPLWEKLWKKINTEKIATGNYRFLGVCFHDFDMRNNEVFKYYAGIEFGHTTRVPKGFKTVDIPANDYAVFTHRGTIEMIEKTYNQIYRNWLPFSEYTPTMDLDIIVLDSRFAGRDEKNEVDILIPVTC